MGVGVGGGGGCVASGVLKITPFNVWLTSLLLFYFPFFLESGHGTGDGQVR